MLGPLTDADIVAMASISREYHPNALFSAGSFENNRTGRVVNHIWIIGLVGLALEQMRRPGRILSVNVNHIKPTLADQRLRFEMEASSLDPMSERAKFEFKAISNSGDICAIGEVIIAMG